MKNSYRILFELILILLCLFSVASANTIECVIIDSEYIILDSSLHPPTNVVLDASGSPIQSNPSDLNYLIDTEFTVVDKSMEQSFEQTSEETPEETEADNKTDIPGFCLFAGLLVLLIQVQLMRKK